MVSRAPLLVREKMGHHCFRTAINVIGRCLVIAESFGMTGKSLIPEPFGALQGVRIISTGTLIAQPFAAELAAEMGAEVIQVERPGVGDIGWRTLGVRLENREGGAAVATNWIQERRNVFCITL